MADFDQYGWPDDDWDRDDSDEARQAAADKCGSHKKRQCDLAGSEWCDWSCPLHNQVFPPKRPLLSKGNNHD